MAHSQQSLKLLAVAVMVMVFVELLSFCVLEGMLQTAMGSSPPLLLLRPFLLMTFVRKMVHRHSVAVAAAQVTAVVVAAQSDLFEHFLLAWLVCPTDPN